MKILLVKTSSMGDVVHNLPVVNDILAAYPDGDVDWVVEDGFSAIPRLHTGVKNVLAAAIRHWRGSWWRAETRREIRAFLEALRSKSYDVVVDTQGLLKSAIVARFARGLRFGLDWKSSREPLAPFYTRTFRVPWTMHAVERNRLLAAQALGYVVPEHMDYGISVSAANREWLPGEPYVVLIHVTSARAKLWPEEHWIELGGRLAKDGVRSVLTWGNPEERERAARIGLALPGAIVPPALSLSDVASLLAGARACVGVDTGLTHLAGALTVTTVGIYCATDPAATGLYGCARAVNLGGIGTSPSVEQVSAALDGLLASGIVNRES